jgi:exodeoxyribonuclease VII large subunit
MAEAPTPLSVWELTELVKDQLESSFPSVWVAGEISNFTRATSGHCYLTLKDARAQIRAVIWRSTVPRIRFELHDGLQVICHGAIEVYAPRGTYQLVIDQVHPQGMGALELALKQLRDKLAAEGLFDPARKRPLPRFPRRVAVITSPTGAAIRDFLQVLSRRWRGTEVLLLPARVQGEGSSDDVVQAIARAHRLRPLPDCLVVTRGGGSLEDLWTFNTEAVVRAVARSRIPIVSAIGHEVDVTLCDLAADVRALTPSEAAERVVPDAAEVLSALRGLQQRLVAALRHRAAAARARCQRLAESRVLRRPLDRLHDLARQLDDCQLRATRAVRQRCAAARAALESLAARLAALNPASVLARGYTLTTRLRDGHLLRDAAELSPGEQIVTRFAAGRAVSRVEQVQPDPPTP